MVEESRDITAISGLMTRLSTYRYLKESDTLPVQLRGDYEDVTDYFALFKIAEITYENKAPRKEALENVISTLNISGINFIYLILGDERGISFYYGISRDDSSQAEYSMEIADIGNEILKPSLQGNFRGSDIIEASADEKSEVLKKLDSMRYVDVIEGSPAINKDDESFQSADRISDIMLGDKFALMVLANPMTDGEINEIRSHVYDFYDLVAPMSKQSAQASSGTNRSNSIGSSESKSTGGNKGVSHTSQRSETSGRSESSGTSQSRSTSQSNSTQESSNQSRSTSTSKSGSESTSENKNSGTNKSSTTGTSDSENEGVSWNNSKSSSSNDSRGSNTSISFTQEFISKNNQEWIKYIDDIILPRIDYGFGKGLFTTSVILFTEFPSSMLKLSNSYRAIYGGESGNMVPLRRGNLSEEEKKFVRRFQIPRVTFNNELSEYEIFARAICAQDIVRKGEEVFLGTWMSTKELSMIAGLPQKEIVGLSLREEVEFGLNSSLQEEETDSNKQILNIGSLVQSGVVYDGSKGNPNIPVDIDLDYLDKHVFVTGVTGSGKTTTCQKLLIGSDENFLVIEPAKTEYRILKEIYPDLLVFTLGNDQGMPFRLNPLEFFEGESITSRVDMLMASMSASFEMEAAIPQLLEAALYKVYNDHGWDIITNENIYYTDPYADGVEAFPTLSDLLRSIDEVVEKQGFDDRLKNDYLGSIRARLQGLLVGAKGLMLDTPRSIDFRLLLEKRVVLELESIKSSSEKSLFMGFVLSSLSEAIKYKFLQDGEPLHHIILVEEAHRLLSKYMPGDSLNKKQGVELFTDMLAEIRKYGESLIIADQIPDKLTPEVLKNTNTKIVHKIFAYDDKEAIGNTMALTKEQKDFLSYLQAGRAIIVHPGLQKAVQVQVKRNSENDTERIPPKDSELRSTILQFYCEHYKKGTIPFTSGLEIAPSVETMDLILKYLNPKGRFCEIFGKYVDRWNKFYKLSSEGEKRYILQIISQLKEADNCLRVAAALLQSMFYDDTEDAKSIKESVLTLLNLLHDEQRVDPATYNNIKSATRKRGGC